MDDFAAFRDATRESMSWMHWYDLVQVFAARLGVSAEWLRTPEQRKRLRRAFEAGEPVWMAVDSSVLVNNRRTRSLDVREDIRKALAGALHPNRGEPGWHPRYNILRLEVRGESRERKLRVQVYQRGWKAPDTCFGQEVDGDGAYPKIFELTLPPWSQPVAKPVGRAVLADSPALPEPAAEETMISTRELVFGLFALSYPDRMRVMLKLQLLDDSDTGIADSELVRRAIRRAKDRDLLVQLADAVKATKGV